MEVECAECGSIFSAEVEVKELGDGIELELLRCPNCSAEYPILKTNEVIRELRDNANNTVKSGTREKLKEEMAKLNN